MKRFTDRVAIVTGAAQGIGAAIARRLGQEGATVVVADINEKAAAKVAKACGNKSFAVATDVGDAGQVEQLHETVVKRAGRIDVLVNNAAIVPFQPWDQVDFDHWRHIMRVNLDGVFLMSRASSDAMRKTGYGRIVNICSNTIFAGTPNMAAYVAAKGGVFGFTRALATELGAYRITVNAVCPGFTETELLARSVQTIMDATGRTEDKAREDLLRTNPQGRFITPEEVAAAVLWLCSPEANSVTGQAIAIDGGETQ